MQPGDVLVDAKRGETPFRVEGLEAVGERYQVARLFDVERKVSLVGRAILYGEEEASSEAVRRRRDTLREQWLFLEVVADTGVAPTPVDWLELDESPVEISGEPVLVCEKVEGPTVYDWIVDEHPRGLEVERALALVREFSRFLEEIHRSGWLWRDFDPRRLRIENGERIRAVSLAGVVAMGTPVADEKPYNADYVAPELRDEVAVDMLRPAGDLYGLGALLSFLLSGEEPRHRVESPITFDAFERLEEHGVEGVRLLLARLLQPMADRRMRTAKELVRYCELESLPTREDRGFEVCELPAPWLGVEIDNPWENRGLRSKLSAGPLVSMRSDGGEAVAPRESGGELDWRMVAAVVVVAVLLVAAGLLIGG